MPRFALSKIHLQALRGVARGKHPGAVARAAGGCASRTCAVLERRHLLTWSRSRGWTITPSGRAALALFSQAEVA